MWALCAAMLSGCWDEVDLSDQGYVSALGVDFQDGHYVLYGQLIQFSSIAKTRTPGETGSNVWIGRGRGKTVFTALGDLQRTSQFSINLEHLKVLVVHKRAIDRIADILDANNRQRASRYTSYVFATDVPLQELFSTEVFFDRSPLLSILYNPEIQYTQRSLIRPVTMQEFVRALDEPGFTALLPSIKLDGQSWSEMKKSFDVQTYNGAVAFQRTRPGAFLSAEELSGFRWIDPQFNQYYMETSGDGADGGRAGTVNVTFSRPDYRLLEGGDNPRLLLSLKLAGHLVELPEPMTAGEIERDIERRVKEDVERTFKIGCEKKVDILELGEYLYRDHHRLWKKLNANGPWCPGPGQLSVQVDFTLAHTGKFDLS